MRNNARYYLARVIKMGVLDQQRIIEAIRNPATLQKNKNSYTFTDISLIGPSDNPRGIFGKLSKYKPQASVQVVRPQEHQLDQENVENLIEAASPFVYIPEFSGLAYQHVWNHLHRDQFEKLFGELIEAKYAGFFVTCVVEPVTDLRTFVMRLARLDKIGSLQAKVRPPNPLFGPCWESLKLYMKRRQLNEVSVKEESEAGIDSRITEIASRMLAQETKKEEIAGLMEPLMGGIGDAAVLMAADGYGRAKVVGVESQKTVTIRTSENQKSFLFSKDPIPEELFDVAYNEFKQINNERYLEH